MDEHSAASDFEDIHAEEPEPEHSLAACIGGCIICRPVRIYFAQPVDIAIHIKPKTSNRFICSLLRITPTVDTIDIIQSLHTVLVQAYNALVFSSDTISVKVQQIVKSSTFRTLDSADIDESTNVLKSTDPDGLKRVKP